MSNQPPPPKLPPPPRGPPPPSSQTAKYSPMGGVGGKGSIPVIPEDQPADENNGRRITFNTNAGLPNHKKTTYTEDEIDISGLTRDDLTSGIIDMSFKLSEDFKDIEMLEYEIMILKRMIIDKGMVDPFGNEGTSGN